MKRVSLFYFIIVFSSSLLAQSGNVEGTVKDFNTGKPLASVNVIISSLKSGTVTDASGNYKLHNIPSGNYTIYFSYIGFKTEEKRINILPSSSRHLNISLKPSPIMFGEVPVFTTKNISFLNDEPIPVDIVTSSQINSLNSISVSDLLKDQPGLAMQRDGIWGTQISIRGLSKSSIVTMIDGNRIETATDLAAALSLIDVNDIERVEVIKGASSSIYGTGALGGVVNIITKSGSYNNSLIIKGSLKSSYATVNNEGMGNISLEAGANNWYARVNSTLRKADNTKTPMGVLQNSQFADNSISFSGGIRPFTNHELTIKYQNFYAKNVGIPGGDLLFPSSALVTYPDEQRQMFSIEYKVDNLTKSLINISAKYFYQVIKRNVINIPYQTKYVTTPSGQPDKIMNVNKITPHAMHYTNGLQFESNWLLSDNNFLLVGLNAWQRNLDSRRERYTQIENIDKTTHAVLSTVNQIIGERPIPESQFRSIGLYAQDELTVIPEKLKLTLSGRFDRINISNLQLSNPVYTITNGKIDNNPSTAVLQWDANNIYNSSWSSNLGILYTVGNGFNVNLSAARSFRAPSLEERYQFIDLGNLVELGNPSLNPEKGYFFDGGIKIWNDNFSFKFDVFSNYIIDLVVQKNGMYEGRPALINTNIGKAVLYGFDTGFEYNAFGNFVFYGTASFVRGRDTEESQNLPQIAPLNGIIGIRSPVTKYLNIDFSSKIFTAQNQIADGEITTPGYAYFDMYVYSKNFNINLFDFQLICGIENMFDKLYRNHLATNRGLVTVEPGRNVFIKTIINW